METERGRGPCGGLGGVGGFIEGETLVRIRIIIIITIEGSG